MIAKWLVKYICVITFYYEPLLIEFALPLPYKHVPTASLLLFAAESS